MSVKLIAHRGNTTGPNRYENSPDYLLRTLEQGYDCEVDVWVEEENVFLGHDEPTYHIKEDFLSIPGFWLHAKNLRALDYLLCKGLTCFWHDKDLYTLTSNGFIWGNVNVPVTPKTIVVTLDVENSLKKVKELPYGICSDYVSHIVVS